MRTVLARLGAGVVVIGLVACESGPSPDARRIEGLEKRLDALEARITATADSAEPVERLVDEAASLERRLTSLETSVRELAARSAAPVPLAPAATPPPPSGGGPGTPPPPVAPAAPGAARPVTRLEREERRAQLRALSDEFRSRLAAMRSEGGDNRQEETRELLEWYRLQRRAILREGGR